MKNLVALFVALVFCNFANAQNRIFTKQANVKFNATSSAEKIEAGNNSGTCVVDMTSGNIESAVLIKGFKFAKALMQEHFNENYMESDKFPKSIFKGKIDNIMSVNFDKDGTYNTKAMGKLTVHGVTKDVVAPVTFTIKGGKIQSETNFNVVLSDYGIDIPKLVSDKVAKTAKISVEAMLQPMK